jgi:iron complex transport system ATP-binding protein
MSAASDPIKPDAQAMARTDTCLSARDLRLKRGGRAVLHDVQIDLPPGWTAVVGPNGAGKSSLLRVLAGVLRPDAGEVRVMGRSADGWTPRERAQALAWMPQSGSTQVPDSGLSVWDVAGLGRLPRLGLWGAAGSGDLKATEAALKVLGADAWRDRPFSALSGGEQQRVLLARALAVEAQVLLLDEPMAHLDPPWQWTLVRHWRSALADTSARLKCVVTVLHDLMLALQADQLLVMREGRVLACGATADPAVRQALCAAFDQAFDVVPWVDPESGAGANPRWFIRPRH